MLATTAPEVPRQTVRCGAWRRDEDPFDDSGIVDMYLITSNIRVNLEPLFLKFDASNQSKERNKINEPRGVNQLLGVSAERKPNARHIPWKIGRRWQLLRKAARLDGEMPRA